MVLCHPWGQEYLRAHRAMRHLAVLLARASVHVLHFDYFGTGDSAGDMTEGDLRGWALDVETAIDELRDTTGAARVGLVGLRLGGTLAATVAARRRDDVDSLVLWDPVVRGDEYVAELDALASPGTAGGGAREVLGFVLPETLSRELAAIDLSSAVPELPPRTLLLTTRALPSHGALRQALGRHPAGPLPFEHLGGEPAWVEEKSSGVGALPLPVLQRIAAWWSRP